MIISLSEILQVYSSQFILGIISYAQLQVAEVITVYSSVAMADGLMVNNCHHLAKFKIARLGIFTPTAGANRVQCKQN